MFGHRHGYGNSFGRWTGAAVSIVGADEITILLPAESQPIHIAPTLHGLHALYGAMGIGAVNVIARNLSFKAFRR